MDAFIYYKDFMKEVTVKQEALRYAAACEALDEAETALLNTMQALEHFVTDKRSESAVNILAAPDRKRVEDARRAVASYAEALTKDSWLAQNRDSLASVLKDIMHYGTANQFQAENLYRSLANV